jgi:hypothetical protein
MSGSRYVQIVCGICGGKILAIGGQQRPTECGLCKAPLEMKPRQTDSGVRAPVAFERGTFTGTSSSKPRTTPAPRVASGPFKAPVAAPGNGGFKEKLLRLFGSRS